MRTVFAAIVGTATGLLVAGAPVANGAVLLLGVFIGAVLLGALQTAAAEYRDMKRGAQPASESAPHDPQIVR